MDIRLENIGKRFAFQTILKSVNLSLRAGEAIGISGRNGAGKSTLLKMISGYLSPSQGNISYSKEGQNIADDLWFRHYVFTAPYIDLPPYFTVKELLEHYRKFKNVRLQNDSEFIDFCELSNIKNKRIGQFSSGMQQRLSLGLAFNSDVDLYLLDEPTSYLDTHAKEWFHQKLSEVRSKSVIIASNDHQDFSGIDTIYSIREKTVVVNGV